MKSEPKFTIFVKKSDTRAKKRKTFGLKSISGVQGVGEVEVSPEVLQDNFLDFVRMLDKIVPDLKDRKTGFSLNSFDVEVGIDGKGKIGFLGTGSELGGHATFTLRFER